jgi:hypothetical protein
VLWLMSAWPDCSKLYARQNEAGTEFEAQRNLMRETFGLDGGGSVASDPGGNVYVAWHGKGPSAGEGESSRQVWIARSADEGRGFVRNDQRRMNPPEHAGAAAFVSSAIRAEFSSAFTAPPRRTGSVPGHRNHHPVSVTRGNVLKLNAYTQGRQTACAFQDLLIQWIVVQRVRRDVGLAFMHCQILVAELLHIAELVGEQ